MAFTKALYYPQIDIQNEGWLKNAILYWDQIQTIVPESISQPYKSGITKELYDEDLLQPFYVNSNMVENLTDEVMKFLNPPESLETIMEELIAEYGSLNSYEFQKMVNESAREVQFFHLHSDKLPYKIRQVMKDKYPDWVRVDERFADFYMTLLATYLSERAGIGLLTDKEINNKLSTVVKLDAIPSTYANRLDSDHGFNSCDVPSSMGQGILANLTIERINIDPHTPIEEILKFRRNHEDELGFFRTEISNLTSTISEDVPLDKLCQQVEDIYLNELKPTISSLEKGLKDSRIRYLTKNFLDITFLSTSAPLALLGFSAPHSLLAAAGVSLVASAISYNLDKKEKLRENPFAYVLEAKKEFI